MPYRDPEKRREAARQAMRKRRRDDHGERESTPVDNPDEGLTGVNVNPAQIVPIRPGISTEVTGGVNPPPLKGRGGVNSPAGEPGEVNPVNPDPVNPVNPDRESRASRGTLEAREAAARAAGNIEEATRLRAQIHDRNAAARDWHAIEQCPLCDRNGFTLTRGGNPPTVEFCDHRVAYAPPEDDRPASPEVAAYWIEKIRKDYGFNLGDLK